MANGNTTPKELHVCVGLNACYQHGKSGTGSLLWPTGTTRSAATWH